MATVEAIADVIDMFLDAPLKYAPRDTNRTGELWLKAFRDIPDDILRKAAVDCVATETDWPSPAKLRGMAEGIKTRNGRQKESAFDQPFVRPQRARTQMFLHHWDENGNMYTEPVDVIDKFCVMTVTPAGWQDWRPGLIELVKPSAEFDAACSRLEALDRLPTDDELLELEKLSGRMEAEE
jgi:hypothetical protein